MYVREQECFGEHTCPGAYFGVDQFFKCKTVRPIINTKTGSSARRLADVNESIAHVKELRLVLRPGRGRLQPRNALSKHLQVHLQGNLQRPQERDSLLSRECSAPSTLNVAHPRYRQFQQGKNLVYCSSCLMEAPALGPGDSKNKLPCFPHGQFQPMHTVRTPVKRDMRKRQALV